MAVRRGGVDDMSRFDPKLCGDVEVNQTIVNNIVYYRQQSDSDDNYNLFKFQMAISIAHEIVHFLTGFLTGSNSATSGTPRMVVLEPYGNIRTGEAGRFLESILLGGVAEFYFNANDPLGDKQVGNPYLLDDGYPNFPAKPISRTYIDSFLRGSKYT
ncbi:hypothetical protein B7463_g10867, partial [Scytalidium lignicola]